MPKPKAGRPSMVLRYRALLSDVTSRQVGFLAAELVITVAVIVLLVLAYDDLTITPGMP